jgi:hypothetical protein
VIIMRGVAERDRRAIERTVAGAWWHERFAREDKFRDLGHYLAQLKPKKLQTGDEILAVFREYQARGAPIKITRIGPDGKEVN